MFPQNDEWELTSQQRTLYQNYDWSKINNQVEAVAETFQGSRSNNQLGVEMMTMFGAARFDIEMTIN